MTMRPAPLPPRSFARNTFFVLLPVILAGCDPNCRPVGLQPIPRVDTGPRVPDLGAVRDAGAGIADTGERVDAASSAEDTGVREDMGSRLADSGAVATSTNPRPRVDDLEFTDFEEPFVPENGCSDQEFFVDVKEFSPAPDFSFLQRFRAQLSGVTAQQLCSWFGVDRGTFDKLGCEWKDTERRWALADPTKLDVQVERVFEPRTLPARSCLLHDGHLRFYRVRFVYDGEGLVVPESSVCTIESTLENAALGEANAITRANPRGGAPNQEPLCGTSDVRPSQARVSFDIGRECPIRTVNGVSGVDRGRLEVHGVTTWHLDQMGVDLAPDYPNLDDDERPEVWLVDTGVYEEIGNALAVEGAETSTINLDGHGSALAAMIRRITPLTSTTSTQARSRVVSERIFNEKFRTRTANLAQALEKIAAEVARDPSRPRIVNLSLGWPTPLTQSALPRPLCGGVVTRLGPSGRWGLQQCIRRGGEGPLGGAVRFALGLLRFGSPQTLVLAAPGNDAAPFFSEADRFRQEAAFVGDLTKTVCTSSAAGRLGALRGRNQSMFYPAEWGPLSPTDRRINPLSRTSAGNARLVMPVGAIDYRQRRVSTTRPRRGLLLEAPGQHVYVDRISPTRTPDGTRVPTTAARCTEGSLPESQRYALPTPSAWSGTSVSTALMSAVAAEAHMAWDDTRGSTLSPPQVLALTYVTGFTSTTTSDLSRRPSLCRLRNALRAPLNSECAQSITKCVTGVSSLDFWEDEVGDISACVDAQRECRTFWPSCGNGQRKTEWPENYPNSADYCTPPRDWVATKTPNLQCPLNTPCVETSASGEIGPQPPPIWCPDCRIEMDLVQRRAHVFIEVNPALADRTTLSNLTMILEPPGQPPVPYVIDASSGIPPELNPGEHVDFVISVANLSPLPPVAGAIMATETAPNGTKTMSLSTLRIE